MKILFLHGWKSVPGGVKPTSLAQAGHEVFNPALPDDDFDAALAIAQAEFDARQPDVVVGSSRGGALAMNLRCGQTPLVLLCPAWKRWGTATSIKPGTIVLHSPADDVIPLSESRELVERSGLSRASLREVGHDHRLADAESLRALLLAVAQHMLPRERLPCCGLTRVERLKELPHLFSFDFDLFRCCGCAKHWMACFSSHGVSTHWEPVQLIDVERMLALDGDELRAFMRHWARDFN